MCIAAAGCASTAENAVALASEVAVKPLPRRGGSGSSPCSRSGLFALGYTIVEISTQEPGDPVVHLDGIEDAQGLFGGMPQEGDRLGSDDAPVTIQVFNDMQCDDCRDDFLSTIPTAGRTLRAAGRREAALPPLLEQRQPRAARLLRRRGGRRPGLRLAVHLPLLPQPGRSRTLRRSTRTSSPRSPAASRNSTSKNGRPTSKRTAEAAARSSSGSKATRSSAATSKSASARRMIVTGPSGTVTLQEGPSLAEVEAAIAEVD